MFDMLPDFALTEQQLANLYSYRLGRLRQAMADAQVDLCVLNNPISLRYAIDCNEYPLFQSHLPTIYLFVPIEGPLRLYSASGRNYPFVEQYARAHFNNVFDGGFDLSQAAKDTVADMQDYMSTNGLSGGKVAIERFTPFLGQVLQQQGVAYVDAEIVVEQAKLIKSPEELLCMQRSVAVAQHGIKQMHEALRPGLTENQLWSILHQVNIAHDGNWIEGHMLASGARTNPWLQEATGKVIEAGELVAFDTDMIGPMGYIADVSRTWLCGDGKPNAQQKQAYQHAYDEIHENMQLIRPGVSFKALSENAFQRAAKYRDHRYVCVYHGVGLSDEYPKIYYQEDWLRDGYDGVLEENMVVCVESFSGAPGEKEGVKLENQVRVTASGYELMSDYAFDDDLLT
ncbi:MAG TPA: aminopeptidase [Oceanospirillaceae bacterium]|nr:aminopeptidase [Oceanospirillaceae bacterium]